MRARPLTDVLSRANAALEGRYTLERQLGRGGMATVWLARDNKHDRLVALKVLRPDVAQAIGPERFLREITLTARLSHPHILPLLDSGEADGLLYYVMPYVQGESLRDRLDREQQLALDDALLLTHEIADALTHAHAHNVVHRDIKPENILLEDGHAVVADFGIARAITAAGAERLTDTGVTVGTPAYMSPEQAAGATNLDGRADVYSLACVLYEMLAGRPPFVGPTAESVVHQQLSAVAPPVTSIRPAVPRAIRVALDRALAKVPADRFRRVDSFAGALTASSGVRVPAPRVGRRVAWLTVAAAITAVGAVAIRFGQPTPEPAAPTHPRTTVAVLPFQNLSAEGPHAYFAQGLYDETLTLLAKFPAIRTISWTSLTGYLNAPVPPLHLIAAELGAGSVVQASVQVVGHRLRVSVRLIDTVTGAHLWAERYDRTLDDAFAIQSDVAQQIVAVVTALNNPERQDIAEAPTSNPEAYRLYLQGRVYHSRPGHARQNLEMAEHLYTQAIALDSRFALAHARLSEVHGQTYWFRYDPSPARAARQREAAEAALRLAPDLPHAHGAMGLVHYWGRRDYRRALDEFTIALRGLPNHPRISPCVGALHRRLGNWDEVMRAIEKAKQFDPRGVNLYYDLAGGTYAFMRRYADAVGAYDRALALAPDLHAAAIFKGWTYVRWQGQLDTLRAIVSRLSADQNLGVAGTPTAQLVQLLRWERRPDSLLRVLRNARVVAFVGQDFYLPTSLHAAWAHLLRGDRAAAAVALDSARLVLDSVLRDLPDDWRVHASRGLTLAALGRHDEALGEARWLEQSTVYREDAYDGPLLAESRAAILAQSGRTDAALQEIERLLSMPSALSVHMLRLDPAWDPIRDDPRFERLVSSKS